MLHTYWMRHAREAFDRYDEEYEKLKTPEQLAERQSRMRQFFVEQLGGFPQRTPLNAQVVERLPRDGYSIEKVIFESQPKLFVTAAFYLPDGKPPYPGVLVPCGHSLNGKASELYQRACVLLAKNGLAVLCYDPIDQGERIQLLDEKNKPRAATTTGHSLLGVGSILLGRNTATFRIWDGMRAIDYLQSRPEVDPKRIGCTGNSGGGTLTSYLMALDERIQAAAPSCYLTSLRRLLETIGPQDAEQNIFAQVTFGMDQTDYVLMRAPRPTLMCCATRDFFDIQGAWDTLRKAKRFYGRMGYPERVDMVETDEKHGFSTLLREGAVRWMRRWLLAMDQPVFDSQLDVLKDDQIRCTPEGQVIRLPGARTAYEINADEADRLRSVRRQFWNKTEKAKGLDEVRRVSGIRPLSELPQLRVEPAGSIQRDGYRIEKLILRPEDDLWLPALAMVPQKPRGDAWLYINCAGKQADAAPGGPMEQLAQQGHVVLAVDLSGMGEIAPGAKATNKYLGADWKSIFLAYLLGKSYVARRAEDVLLAARFLQTYPASKEPRTVRVISIGETGPAVLHAAALEPALFASVTLRNCLGSWDEVVRTPMAVNQFVNCVHGALRVYDLPDLAASLPKGRLKIEEPFSALNTPAEAK